MTDINHAATGTQGTHDFSHEPGAPQPDAFVETDRSTDDRRDIYEYGSFDPTLTPGRLIAALVITLGAAALLVLAAHYIGAFLGWVLP